jgi:hydrogenase expression/formation protein HypD
MKYLDEFREFNKVKVLAERIRNLNIAGPVNIMEVCGSQTHTIMKYALEELIPDEINIVHGPGCPVCVTPVEMIDNAMNLAREKDVILSTYGDMMRVPGTAGNMLNLKAEGADIRIIYSPLDAVKLACRETGRKVVLFAIGFETTAPANAAAVLNAVQLRLKNFYIISSQVLIPPAVEMIMNSGPSGLDALLAPGHVCAVTGYKWCEEISAKYKIPVVVTGFEPVDILEGILVAAEHFTLHTSAAENQYRRVVNREGNPSALKIMNKVFEKCDRNWRGIGCIPHSGYSLKMEYEAYDALKYFGLNSEVRTAQNECIAGEILQGKKKPDECRLFRTGCNPGNPLGAPMVSSEGTCAAYFRYRRKIG